MLGQALKSYFDNPSLGLQTYMSLYQATRLPRAHKAQTTSRQAGELYEMQGPAFEGLTFEQGLQVIHDKFRDRMGWVWGHDLEADVNAVKKRLGLGSDKTTGVMNFAKPANGMVSVEAVSVL